jgi:hypothetical protein
MVTAAKKKPRDEPVASPDAEKFAAEIASKLGGPGKLREIPMASVKPNDDDFDIPF